MFEKVNPSHPDKIADRIGGAIVDLGYKLQENPKIAVEVLIGHGNCHIIIESSVDYNEHIEEINNIVYRISQTNSDTMKVDVLSVKQDEHLAENQSEEIKCGDNGIFKGMPVTEEERRLSDIVREMYARFPYDGKYIIDDKKLIACQSNATEEEIRSALLEIAPELETVIINPLGYWTGGINVDTGATNRKLGSDMAQSVTGGGLHGKCLSKADVSVNIYAYFLAQVENKPVELHCAIGDTEINGKPYADIVKIAETYIRTLGGFEKFAEWGLV